jgi:hypothetical protein
MPKSRGLPGGVPTDHFGAIPLRAHDALRRGDISFQAYGLLCFLICECYRQGDEAVYTLASLRDAAHWDKSIDTLRRELRNLKPDWIDFEVIERQRKPYVIRLTDAMPRHFGKRAAKAGSETPQPTAAVRQSDPADEPFEQQQLTGVDEKQFRSGRGADETRADNHEDHEQEQKVALRVSECDDCGEERELVRWGKVDVCSRCAMRRARVQVLGEPEPLQVGSEES